LSNMTTMPWLIVAAVVAITVLARLGLSRYRHRAYSRDNVR
jgi:hypothetical protein